MHLNLSKKFSDSIVPAWECDPITCWRKKVEAWSIWSIRKQKNQEFIPSEKEIIHITDHQLGSYPWETVNMIMGLSFESGWFTILWMDWKSTRAKSSSKVLEESSTDFYSQIDVLRYNHRDELMHTLWRSFLFSYSPCSFCNIWLRDFDLVRHCQMWQQETKQILFFYHSISNFACCFLCLKE